MNRRALIRRLLGATAAGGMTATITDASPPPAPAPFLMVFTAPGPISVAVAVQIKRYTADALADSAFARCKVFVLGDGMTLQTFGADGRPLTQPVTVPKRRARRPRAAP